MNYEEYEVRERANCDDVSCSCSVGEAAGRVRKSEDARRCLG
jgi:hypothetical protein